jgi:hypothetical protein
MPLCPPQIPLELKIYLTPEAPVKIAVIVFSEDTNYAPPQDVVFPAFLLFPVS